MTKQSQDYAPKPSRPRSRLPDPLKFRSGVIFSTLPGLVFVGLWSGAVTYVHIYHYNLQVDEGLVPLLGIVTSIAIAFKLYVSYQRYQDARTQWSRLRITTRNLARLIWFNVPDGPRIRPKTTPPTQIQVEQKLREDLLSKASVIRLLVGFAFALKHHVRREYGTEWPDVRARVGYLPTFARRGHPTQVSVSQSLYTEMDPEKGLPAIPLARRISTAPALWMQTLFSKEEAAKRQQNKQNHDSMIAHQNLPLEILSFLGSYADSLNGEKKLEGGLAFSFHQELATLNDILGNCESLMESHMPTPYAVIISQIKWLFLILLPFQLLQSMSWITVPAVVITAFSLLGLSAAASTLSNPFQAYPPSPTSLPLDQICATLSIEIDTICSATHQPSYSNYVFTGMHMMVAGEKAGVGWMYLKGNKPLAPLVKKDYADCVKSLSISDILEVMKMKVEIPEG